MQPWQLGMARRKASGSQPHPALPGPPCSLHSNALPELPPELGRLTECVRLSLYQNRLSGLPAQIGNMSALQVCDGLLLHWSCCPWPAAAAARLLQLAEADAPNELQTLRFWFAGCLLSFLSALTPLPLPSPPLSPPTRRSCGFTATS